MFVLGKLYYFETWKPNYCFLWCFVVLSRALHMFFGDLFDSLFDVSDKHSYIIICMICVSQSVTHQFDETTIYTILGIDRNIHLSNFSS